MDRLSYRVWQRMVAGLNSAVALELAAFPKLFKRLTVRHMRGAGGPVGLLCLARCEVGEHSGCVSG